MFSINEYPAQHYIARVSGGGMKSAWEDCRVIGIDASGDEPQYLIEIRNASGEYYLEKTGLIKKPVPTTTN